MTLQAGQRSTFNDVYRPEDLHSVKLSSQGDGTGLTEQAAAGFVITGSTNATPIVITANTHLREDGDLVNISGITGNTNANGLRLVANKDADTFELTDLEGVDIVGNGAHGGSGLIYICLWHKVPSTLLMLVDDFMLHAADSAFKGASYMNISALTNGMRLEVYRGATLLKDLSPTQIHDFGDWGDVHALQVRALSETAGSDSLAFAEGRLGLGLMRLDGFLGDSLILIQQDDLSGLLHQEATIGGVQEALS